MIESEPYTGIAVQRDIKFGDDARHPLDIFMPKAPSASPRPGFLVQSEGLNDASCRPGRCPIFQRMASHCHMSEIYSIRTDNKVVGNAMLAFVKAH